MNDLRDIPIDEWDAYEWIEATDFGNAANGIRVFIRGRKKPPPRPDDGYAYVEPPHSVVDKEWSWIRARTYTGRE